MTVPYGLSSAQPDGALEACATVATTVSNSSKPDGMGDGSRSEVRGFRNFEPRTSNFESHLALVSQEKTLTEAVLDGLVHFWKMTRERRERSSSNTLTTKDIHID
jgi:hypothetical protein